MAENHKNTYNMGAFFNLNFQLFLYRNCYKFKKRNGVTLKFWTFFKKIRMSNLTYLGYKSLKKVVSLEDALNPEKIIQNLAA